MIISTIPLLNIFYWLSSMCSLSEHPLIAGEIVQQFLAQTRFSREKRCLCYKLVKRTVNKYKIRCALTHAHCRFGPLQKPANVVASLFDLCMKSVSFTVMFYVVLEIILILQTIATFSQ